MTSDEWRPLGQALAAAFPHDFKSEVVKDRLSVFFLALAPYPGEAVKRAVLTLIRTKRAFPAIADLVELIESPEGGATEAWITACQWASQATIGPTYRAGEIIEVAELHDAATARAVQAIGGAEAIRQRTVDGEAAMRAHFFRAYGEARTALAGRAVAAQLAPGPVAMLTDGAGRIGRQLRGG